MDGILIIDKPVGFTSHDVVARVRRILKEKRIGHTGTLDPFATGVLVLLIGRATRLAQFLNAAEKEYLGIIRFGYATDTGDATGTIWLETKAKLTSEDFAKAWDATVIENALAPLRGTIEQVPPMYSAKKIKGRKLYELARKGEEVERAAVQVTVHEFEAIETDGALLIHNPDGTCDLAVRIVCSAGTYIRTLAESVGERLKVPAHLSSLRRTRAGDFHIEDAHTLVEIEELMSTANDAASLLLPLRSSLPAMASTQLTNVDVQRVCHGGAVRTDDNLTDAELVQMCDETGDLIAIGIYNQQLQTVQPRVVLASDIM